MNQIGAATKGSAQDLRQVDTTFGFCCGMCRCEPNARSNDFYFETAPPEEDVPDMEVAVPFYAHLACCHRHQRNVQEWSPLHVVIEKSLQELEEGEPKKKRQCTSRATLKEKYLQAKREEARISTEMFDVDAVNLRWTNETHTKAVKDFNAVIQERQSQPKRPAVVMEVFAGIGSGLVVLKPLKIDISTVITVEHDPAAKHVLESNHSDLKPFHIEKFEDVKLDEIFKRIGARKYVTKS